MKKRFILFTILSLLVACAPVAKPAGSAISLPQPSQTSAPAVINQPTATIEPSPTDPSQAKPTKKPKGHNQPIAPTSTSPDFIAYEITGRPTRP